MELQGNRLVFYTQFLEYPAVFLSGLGEAGGLWQDHDLCFRATGSFYEFLKNPGLFEI